MKNKVEWSNRRWKEFIVEQRKRLWLPDTVEKLAKWLDLRQGMQVADIGCGLGYLGWTYWKYFGDNGSYIGVDISEKLIEEAQEMSHNWAIGGIAEFKTGNAYILDWEDNSFDLAEDILWTLWTMWTLRTLRQCGLRELCEHCLQCPQCL